MPKKQYRVLIVEDDKILSKALRDKFISENYDVEVANDGAVGLQKALTERPDIILLDIVMPVMDGLSMLKKIRTNEWGKNVPIILLTNLNMAEKVAEALESKAYDYLVKSDWKLEDVVKKVESRLKIK